MNQMTPWANRPPVSVFPKTPGVPKPGSIRFGAEQEVPFKEAAPSQAPVKETPELSDKPSAKLSEKTATEPKAKPSVPPKAKKRKKLSNFWLIPFAALSAAAGFGVTSTAIHIAKTEKVAFIEPQGWTVETKDGKQIARKDGVELVDTIPDNTTEKIVLANVDSVLVKAKLGKIKTATLATNGYPMYAFELNNTEGTVMLLPRPTSDTENQRLIQGLAENNLNVTTPKEPSLAVELLARLFSTVLYLGLLMGMLMWVLRSAQGAGFMTDMKKKLVKESPDVKMDDVQGIDEVKEEVQEIVDYLKNPLDNPTGAKMPRGILLVGPPGNGKTMLAKAIATEAKVPFFAVNASEFVEMFVGRGAGRVRSIFAEAKKNAPCVLFIDELDTVGQKRGSGYGGSNSEQEQTLNQILSEMDGFFKQEGIVVVAATNRPDVLDDALLSRFTKQVPVMRPQTNAQRVAILKVHTRKKPLAANVDLNEIAGMTSGFSGRKLADLVEEAARLTNRRIRAAEKEALKQKAQGEGKAEVLFTPEEQETRQLITQKMENLRSSGDAQDAALAEALEKQLAQMATRKTAGLTEEDYKVQQQDLVNAWQNVLIGPGKPLHLYDPEFLKRVAVHEGLGHAWLCRLLDVPMHIISTQPRGETGGIVAFDESAFNPMIQTKKDKLTQLLITLGGMAAEEVMYDGDANVSTGPTGDLDMATDQLKTMISRFGMFPKEFGLMVDRPNPVTKASSYTPEQQRQMEVLVQKVLTNAYGKVKAVIEKLPTGDRARLLKNLQASPVVAGKENTTKVFKESIQEADIPALQQMLREFIKNPVPPEPQAAK